MNKYFYSVKQLDRPFWLTTIVLLFFLVFGSFDVNAQVSVIGTTAGTTVVNYNTLNEAFAAINAGTHKGDISVTITGNTSEPATEIPLLKSATPSSYTSILIKPSGGDFTINSAANPTANKGVVILQGADNVTIDGDDPSTAGTQNLSIVVATNSNTGTAAIQLASNSTSGADGADNNIIKNCIIKGGRNSAGSTITNYGIVMSNISSISSDAVKSINTKIQNNLITRSYYGIYGNSSQTFNCNNIQILNNTIGSAVSTDEIGYTGIYVNYYGTAGNEALIQGNDIRVGNSGSTSAIGIDVLLNSTGINIVANNIHDIHSDIGSANNSYAIQISGASYLNIDNNMIYNIYGSSSRNVGFRTSGGGGSFSNSNLRNNTIVIGGGIDSQSSGAENACVRTTATLSNTSFLNNIFVNLITNSTGSYIFNDAARSINTLNIIDYNCYYGTRFSSTSSAQTLSGWQSYTGQDVHSIFSNPPFVSASDLHILYNGANAVALNGAGTPIANVTTDFDGEARNATTPDIGADEFSLNPITSFSPTALCAQGGQTVTITGTNFSQITSVKFNGISATSFTTVNSTTITAVLPAGSTGGFITIVNGVDSVTSTAAFTVNQTVTPTFSQVAPICSGTTIAALPTTSTNGITGTWSPAINNTTTTTYTFTPNAGQCANTTTQTVTILTPSTTSTISFVAPMPAIGLLNVGSATIIGILTNGIPASGVTASIPYTGGNGISYATQTVSSSGVNGLTATLLSDVLSNGTGSLLYTISGTATTSGTASFAITLGGQSGTFVISVVNLIAQYPTGSVFCGTGPTAIVDVTNPITGKVWMDRNLGASQAAASTSDASAYGDLYQWGRGNDGHQCRNSATTTTFSATDQPVNGKFILYSNSTGDWRSPQNNNLWQGVNGLNNPCPSGYRIPTKAELDADKSSWSLNSISGAFASPSKFTAAGGRLSATGYNGDIVSIAQGGVYWSSTISGTTSLHLEFGTLHVGLSGTITRADGNSIRCIKN